MTHEQKLSIVLGFSICLVVALLISDYFSAAESDALPDAADEAQAATVVPVMPPALIGQGTADPAPLLPAPASPDPGLTSITSGGMPVSERQSLAQQVRRWASRVDLPTLAATNRAPTLLDVTTTAGRAASDDPPAASLATHLVRTGETLSGIASRRLGSARRWREILELNRDQLASDKDLRPGQRLRLPPTVSATPTEAADPPRPPQPTTYRARPGDTLSKIARERLGRAGRWREIFDLNRDRLRTPDVLEPGTTLRIPRR